MCWFWRPAAAIAERGSGRGEKGGGQIFAVINVRIIALDLAEANSKSSPPLKYMKPLDNINIIVQCKNAPKKPFSVKYNPLVKSVSLSHR